MKTIAIIGANGRLGTMAATAFHNAGYKVIGVTRTGIAPPGTAIEYKSADARNQTALIQACAGADYILNALNLPYREWRTQALPMAKNVIAAAMTHKAVHLFAGNIYNYGRGIPEFCDENTPPDNPTAMGKIRINMEMMFAERAHADKVKTIVLRAGDFYGGTTLGSWFDMAICAKTDRAIFTYPGPMDVEHAWAYLPDLSNVFVQLAEASSTLGVFEIFTFGGHTLTGSQIFTYIQDDTNMLLKQRGLPWGIIKVGKIFAPSWRGISEMSYLWKRPHRLSNTKLEATLASLNSTPQEYAIKTAFANIGRI